MLREEMIDKSISDLIKQMQGKEYLNEFYLVGGTGLAIHLGHRKSDDIDLFSLYEFDQEQIQEKLESDFSFQTDFIEKNTLKGSIAGIKVDIITHPYKYIQEPVNIDNLHIASLEDICAMKLNAIANDETRVKDFIDMYFLLGRYDLRSILGFFQNKYELRNPMHALKSLTFFDEVDRTLWPEMILEKELTWEQVEKRIENKYKAYHSSLRNS